MSGLNALLWHSEWERYRDQGVKQQLITYNAEDCEAVQRVAEAIACVCNEKQTATGELLPCIKVNELAGDYPRRFGPVNFAMPAFEQINAASYWDYQRNKVYVRTSDRLRRASRTQSRGAAPVVRASKEVQVEAARPTRRTRCGGSVLHKNGRSPTRFTIYGFPKTGFGGGWFDTGSTIHLLELQ